MVCISGNLMLRYYIYLLLYIPVQLFAYAINYWLPSKAVMQDGPIDNNNGTGVEPRLVGRWKWAMTYDNSLWGDKNWKANNDYKSLEAMRSWLIRNSCYTFKRDRLGAPANDKSSLDITGPSDLNHHTKTYGVMEIVRSDGYWQYKSVRPFMGRVLILNFGWLLDDPSQEKALFMCSPRWKKVS
jgi:hypothetical protein